MSEERYTNLDLDTAEELLIAAGKQELAVALRYQAQGVRNLVQGEWGGAFVRTLENVMDTRVVAVLTNVQQRLDEQIGLVEQLITMVREANTTAQEALNASKESAARLGKQIMVLDARDARQYKHTKQLFKESQDDRRDIHAAIAALQAKLDTYIAGSKRTEVEDLRREIDILKQARGDG